MKSSKIGAWPVRKEIIVKRVKVFAFVLALLMVLPLGLSGCSGGSTETGKQNGQSEVNAAEVYDAPHHDLGGHEFWFLVRTTGVAHLEPNEIFADDLTGDKINDAVYKRNSNLEKDFNCTIHQELNPDPVKAVREQLIAGEYQYDYIYSSVWQLRQLSAKNLLVDFKSLENINLDKVWWDKEGMEGLSIANKVFYGTGDASTMDDRGSQVIYLNRDILSHYHIEEDLYQTVRDGKWTVDKMYEIMMQTKEDLDGDGVYTVGKDRFGYIGEAQNNYFHITGFNVHITEMTKDGELKIPGSPSSELVNAWEALKPILASEYRDVSDSGSRFRAGLGTFFGCNLGVLFGGKLSQIDFGILPLPKMNEEQEHYWTSPHFSITFGYSIPTTTDLANDAEANGFSSGREQAAYFLDAFAYYSRDTLADAFYNEVMTHQQVKDSETVEMLEIALAHKHYDVVGLFDFGKLGRQLFMDVGSGGNVKGVPGTDVNYDTLVSVYESRVSAARKALNNYINYVTAEDEPT